MKCPFCEKENNDSNVYCTNCGMKLPEKNSIDSSDLSLNTNNEVVEKPTQAMTFGLISFIMSIVCCCLIFVSQIVSVILGIIAIFKGVKDNDSKNSSKCTLGIVFGILGIIISIALIVYYIYIIIQLKENPDLYQEYYDAYFQGYYGDI